MIVWLASYPGSGDVALSAMLKDAFGLTSVSAYGERLDGQNVREAGQSPDDAFERGTSLHDARVSRDTVLVRTHAYPQDDAKAIYLVRDGRAAIVSYHSRLNREAPLQPVSMQDVIFGRVEHGSWSEHVEAWAPQTRSNTLFLRYDDVLQPSAEMLSSIAGFLGVSPTDGDRFQSSETNRDAATTADLSGQGLSLFWWLHGQTMRDLGFADSVPAFPEPDMARTWFLAERAQAKTELALMRLQSEALRAKLVAAEAERDARKYEVGFLRNGFADLGNSSWLKLGHKLRVTRTLDRIRSDLLHLALPPPPQVGSEFPYEHPPEKLAFHAASTARALERIRQRGLDVETVIDVGASNGSWSAVAEQILAPARYVLIEAQDVHREALEAYCRAHPRAEFVLAAAGDRNGETFFDDRTPSGGVVSREATAEAATSVPMVTIDDIVVTRGLPGPFLIKLDTHGFEVPILNGAVETLKAAELVVIEVYNFRILDQSLLFFEMCAFMRQHGFRVIDFSEPLWREKDRSFWQMDLFFVPANREEFDSNAYE